MSHPIKLPDISPEITSPTLLVVCDNHHCKLYDVGGHTILAKEEITSAEAHYTDRQGSKVGGSGVVGVGESDQVEEHRQREFANKLIARIEHVVRDQKIVDLYLSAPGKFLSHLKKDLPKSLSKVLETAIDGNFVKESPASVLARFRPDLKAAVDELHDQENYSSKKHLPK